MEAQLIQIGNSKGVRLPGSLIKEYGLKGAIEITPTPEGILITPAKKKAREGWEEQIKAVIDKYGPEEIDHEWVNMSNEFDEKEWTW